MPWVIKGKSDIPQFVIFHNHLTEKIQQKNENNNPTSSTFNKHQENSGNKWLNENQQRKFKY